MAFATILLTGCKSLYGKYERPEVNTSGLFRDAMADRDTLAAQSLYRSAVTRAHREGIGPQSESPQRCFKRADGRGSAQSRQAFVPPFICFYAPRHYLFVGRKPRIEDL